MNLTELSRITGRSPDELKADIKERFKRIILADGLTLNGEIVEHYLSFVPKGPAAEVWEQTRPVVGSSGSVTAPADNGPTNTGAHGGVRKHGNEHTGGFRRTGNANRPRFANRPRGGRSEEDGCGATEQRTVRNFAPRTYPKELTDGELNARDMELLKALGSIRYPELKYTGELLKYCVDNKILIFIDTCSILNESFYDFYKLFIEAKGNSDYRLYVPYVVGEELKNLIRRDQDIKDKALEVLEFIGQEQEKGNLAVIGDDGDRRTNERGERVIHADRLIIEKLIYFRNDSRSSLFITQDHDATVDALKQNDWKSTRSNAVILVKKIVRGGCLVDNTNESDTDNPRLPIDN